MKLWSEVAKMKTKVFVRNNKTIRIDNKMVFSKNCMQSGMWYVDDMFQTNGDRITFSVWKSHVVNTITCYGKLRLSGSQKAYTLLKIL